MRGLIQSLLFATVGALVAVTAHAQGYSARGESLGWQVSQPTRFMVSGVLQKSGTVEIKPVHGIFTAKTGEEAVEQFANQVRSEYPGYALISTLASPVPLAGTCELHI
ncbi:MULTISPECIES: hypothetical protein [Ralstonia]|jgi:hypothetical protein|uniref:Uncharacterized protein n=2 Tax=Ralstonia TaxID=48736 RepID=A0AAD2F2T2_9RALS|nr:MULTISPECIES: hypothetical protein [Ralstonia]NMV39936.1 hypothetical protein [Ralstonia insidiosa]CAJ0807593.1 hypothetical protein R77560_04597 [Ralstonia sp. LMG 18095]